MVPIFRQGFHVSRPTHLSSMYAFRLRAITLYGCSFPEHSSKHIKTFGLIRFLLATTYGISSDFFSSGYLDVSSSPGLLPDWLGDMSSTCRVCPIRTSADQFVCANPRSFSQLTTSFVASWKPRHPAIRLTISPIRSIFLYSASVCSRHLFVISFPGLTVYFLQMSYMNK